MAQSALDLDVWKEIAIAKQILIKTATDARGIDPECSDTEFKTALEIGIRQITDAESKVSIANKENQTALDAINKSLTSTEKARAELETAHGELLKEKQALDSLLESTRKTSTEDLIKINQQLEVKVKALKTINVTLADTPENVVKKLKALNKKKLDETNAKKRAEDELRAIKKEKQQLQKEIDEKKATLEASSTLVEQYRELRAFSQDQYTLLKELLKKVPKKEKTDELKSLPDVDEALLKSLDSSDKSEDTDAEESGKPKKSKKAAKATKATKTTKTKKAKKSKKSK